MTPARPTGFFSRSVALLLAALLLGTTLAWSAPPVEKRGAGVKDSDGDQQASKLVAEALFHEVLGEESQRAELLAEALQAQEDYAPALWSLGQVQAYGKWSSLDDAMARLTDDHRLKEYRLRRERAEQTVASQLALAEFCQRRGLDAQAKAHLFRVIEMDPDHVQARTLAGFQRIDGLWVHQDQIEEAQQQVARRREELKAWRAPISRLVARLMSKQSAVQQQAHAELEMIEDPTVSTAIEIVLCQRAEPLAQVGVEQLARIEAPETSEALARQAVLSPWPEVREQAALALQNRKLIEYAPLLLNELSSTLRVTTLAEGNGNDRLIHREILIDENAEARQFTVRDSDYRRRRLPNSIPMMTWNRMVGDAESVANQNRGRVADENRRRAMNNEVVFEALRTATSQDLESDPQTWWEWWDSENDISRTSKTNLVNYDSRTLEVTDVPLPTGPGSSGGGQQTTGGIGECLAAGTLVWTDRGPVEIEAVQVGDLVLSQDVDSGAVGFQPVLRCTERSPEVLVSIRLKNETLNASEGHPFWVAGDGWVLAKDLEVGMVLHGQDGGVVVQAIESGPEAETFNLVVEKSATYFVGESRVLGHDFTMRTPTSVLLPGLDKQGLTQP